MSKIVVFTGAGISAESGVPTFRDRATGIWAKYDPEQLATRMMWEKKPKLVSQFHKDIRDSIIDKEPNSAHKYFSDLEKDHDVTIVTQNIDDLHEKAGSSNILHLHGEINKVECQSTFEVLEVDESKGIMFGHKTPFGSNGELYKPYTVLFDEYPHNINETYEALLKCEYLIIVGTSFEISYVLPMLQSGVGDRGVKIFYIDVSPAEYVKRELNNLVTIRKQATTGVKELPFNKH